MATQELILMTRPSDPEKRKLALPLDPSAWHGAAAETVWTHRAPGGYVIDNIPAFAYDISLGDIVSASLVAGSLTFDHVTHPSRNSTYRVLFPEDKHEWLEPLLKAVESFGCAIEQTSGPLCVVAINVPPDADLPNLYSFLEQGQDAGRWTFEEASFRHQSATA